MLNKVTKRINKSRPIVVNNTIVSSIGNEFEGKTTIVIGGGTGIGLEIAKDLQLSGAKVIICGRNNYDHEGLISFVMDVSKTSEIKHFLQTIISEYGQVDFVVNAQGICPKIDFTQDFYNITVDDFENVLRVNSESVFFICQYMTKYFLENNIRGHILNICSTEGLKGAVVPYGISKAAVVSMTKGLGKKLAKEGITINGIAPGATSTKMMGMDSNGDLRKDYIPSQRATTPLEIAKLAHLLLSDAGCQMCGEVVVMDGGESLH